ncbi:chloride channel protein [Candidatus Avelusimicrobium fimicolum]|uniref:chloride channel protein n=1 Tax=Candidatus Avelusimicrobium fimicolum TaxID=3416216 RepID=UPI003D10B53F
MLDEHRTNFINIVKWFLLATVIGALVGVLDAAFLKILDASIEWRNGIPLFYLGLPVFLYIVALLGRKTAKRDKDFSTDAVINKINAQRSISFISILKGFTLPIVTMVSGGSAGKEAPCADVGAGVSSILARLLRMDPENQRKMMICGVSAGFAGVFGVPISGALFGLEVLWVGHIFYEVMFPALVAGITAFQVTSFLGVDYIYHPLHFVPVFSEQFFLKMIVAGMFFGLVSILFIEISKFARVVFRYIALRTRLFWACMIGGLVLVAIGYFASPIYLGLGMPGIDMALNGEPLLSPFGFLYKIITTSVTFAAGGIGGVVTPIFFVGAQAGAMLADFMRVDSATLAALGLVAVLAGTANTPLAASIMAIELFGPAIAPYATVVCVISFLITGRQSIYPSQRISMDSGKTLEEEPALHHKHYGRRASDRKQRIHPRKTLLKKAVREMVRHLIPNPKGFDEQK